MGKHIDKIPWDRPDGTHTLPVVMGERAARVLTQAMMAAFYVLVVALVAVRALPVPSLLVLLALPRLVPVWKAFSRPRPDAPPDDWPIWPLWFAGLAFAHTRRAGALFVVGLALGLAVGW
jgi:1,4-dihydroxy-2-naphthoate octaprenyltransferase